jgi:hypothetical protein
MSTEFRTLVRHFFDRFFDREARAEESDAHTGIVQILSILLLPGLLMATIFHISNPFVYVCYSMVVMGLIMTLKWDMLFPDRRDYLILSPLPILPEKMFMAKVTALFMFLLLFAVAINVFSIILVPLIYGNPSGTLGGIAVAITAHAAAVLGASLFTALFFAAVQGVLINILAPTTFRRISPRIQLASITVLVTTFLTMPLFAVAVRFLSERYPKQLTYFPVIWFVGLYRWLDQTGATMPMAAVWARIAIVATGLTAVVCASTYFIGYRRYARKILQSADSEALPPGILQKLSAWVLNHTVLRDPFERATFYFIGTIANRSLRHRIITALYTGAGIALAVSFAFVFDSRATGPVPFKLHPQGSLDGPIMLSFLIVTGLRATFNVPYELGANWMFQIATGPSANYLKAVRKWVFLCRIVPLYAVLAFLEFAFFPPALALVHLTFDLILSAIVIELFFLNFNKVPFTCSYPHDKFRMAGVVIGYLYGFVIYVGIMGGLKNSVSSGRTSLATFVIVAALLLFAIFIFRRYIRDRAIRVVYQETGNAPLSIAADAGYWTHKRFDP